MQAVSDAGLIEVIIGPIVLFFVGLLALTSVRNLFRAIDYFGGSAAATDGGIGALVHPAAKWARSNLKTLLGGLTIKMTIERILAMALLAGLCVIAAGVWQMARNQQQQQQPAAAEAAAAPKKKGDQKKEN